MLEPLKKMPRGLLEPEPADRQPWRDGMDFGVVRSKLQKRRAMLAKFALAGAAVALLLGALYGSIKTRAYTASSDLLISNTSLQFSGPDAVVTQQLVENSLIQSEMELLKSDAVLGRAINNLGAGVVQPMLPHGHNFLKRVATALGFSLDQMNESKPPSPEDLRASVLEALKSNVSVARVGSTQIITVHATAVNGADAATLANELVNSFVVEQNKIYGVVTTNGALRELVKVIGPTARIVSAAMPGDRPDGFSPFLIMALAVPFGGFLGLATGMATAVADSRVRCAKQLAMVSPAEFFGYVPKLRNVVRRWWLADQPPKHSAQLNDVLRLVRSVVSERSSLKGHLIGITSCSRGEGKTTLAVSLARLIAAEGRRVLLIDAAQSGNELTRRFAPNSVNGVSQVLNDFVSLTDAVVPIGGPNLYFLPQGKGGSDVDTRWPELLRALAAHAELHPVALRNGDFLGYETVILDLPTLYPTADVRVIGKVIDDLIVVVESGATPEDLLNKALQSLGPVKEKLLGFIINKSPVGLGRIFGLGNG
jgi:Mrp family chromosome partitioning ATPase/capsular polysaccharide biosynthesis protein